MSDALRVKGLAELLRAFDSAGKQAKKALRDELRAAGNIVRDDARQRFSSFDTRSAAGFRTVVRKVGLVSVEQTRRRVTGRRPDFGALQMRRALIPSVRDNEERVIASVEKSLDKIVERF